MRRPTSFTGLMLGAGLLALVLTSEAAAQVRGGWWRSGFRTGVATSYALPYAYGAYGGYPYGGGYGLGDALRGAGEYNLNTSQAMINTEEARSKYIDNKLKWTQVYWERQRIGKQALAEQYAEDRAARERWMANREPGAPPRLTSSQLDPSTGKIYWPLPLTTPAYSGLRQKLDELYVLRASTDTNQELVNSIRNTANDLKTELKSNIREMTPNDYIEARKFLDSLAWEGQFPAT